MESVRPQAGERNKAEAMSKIRSWEGEAERNEEAMDTRKGEVRAKAKIRKAEGKEGMGGTGGMGKRNGAETGKSSQEKDQGSRNEKGSTGRHVERMYADAPQ